MTQDRPGEELARFAATLRIETIPAAVIERIRALRKAARVGALLGESS